MAAVAGVIGVDVGGTNTDAVVLNKQTTPFSVISQAKTATTADVTTGVKNAIYMALKRCREKQTQVAVQQVNIGTTHFINAVVEGKRLVKTAVIRLCGTASRKLPPFSDIPDTLDIKGEVFLLNGGYQFDGREITKLGENEIVSCIQTLKEGGQKHIVVSGIFSPIRPDQELKVLELIERHFPEASVTLSHTIGQIGILERENAAVLNECIKPLCQETILGFRQALRELGLKCPMFLTQNDGTIISEENALKFPVHTFASGATNSMRGAAFLSGMKNAIVIDVGGTSTDVGLLQKGFPREASSQVKIGGVRTNFRMPDVVSIGLGGGSYITTTDAGTVSVGPLSAGYRLQEEAKVFSDGSDIDERTLTATDIAVAAGLVNIGRKDNVLGLSKPLVEKALHAVKEKLAVCIDQMRFSDRDLPVVLVGGGSILIDARTTFEGVSKLVIPPNYDVANAVGAALSQVSSSVDIVVNLEQGLDNESLNNDVKERMRKEQSISDERKTELLEQGRKDFLLKAREAAMKETIASATDSVIRSGGDPTTVEVVDKSDISLTYIPGGATRIKVKMVAEIRVDDSSSTDELAEIAYEGGHEKVAEKKKQYYSTTGENLRGTESSVDYSMYQTPTIDSDTGEWLLNQYDIECICIGAGILGCGGGGNPHIGKLLALQALKSETKLRVVSPDHFVKSSDPENDIAVIIAYMGAPLVYYEKLISGNEGVDAVQCLQDIYSRGFGLDKDRALKEFTDSVKTCDGVSYIDDYQQRINHGNTSALGQKRIAAIMSLEIGGMNSILPLLVAAEMDLPVLDCDGMGRAFPELQMFTPLIYGCKPYPSTLADDKGRRAVVLHCDSAKRLEDHFRRVVIEMGCNGAVVISPLQTEAIQDVTIRYSLSRAWRLGNTVLRARHENRCPVDAVVESEAGQILIAGKVTDVRRETTAGFNKGFIVIQGLETYTGQQVSIEFQNEFLIARRRSSDGVPGDLLAVVPDLITMMDSDTGQPIPTEEVRFGMRVTIVAIAVSPLMNTDQALKVVGPQAFGYPEDVAYKSTIKYVENGPIGPK